MKKLIKRLSAFLMALALVVTASAAQLLTAEAEGIPPSEIVQCESNFGYDFKITFPDSVAEWLSAVTGVTVGGTTYTKVDSSYGVNNDTNFYVGANSYSNYLLIGEAAVSDTAECVISADGYADLVLELNKSSHTAAIKTSQGGGDDEHIHTGGTATCQQKAVCEVCGEEYGQLGDHNMVGGKCTVCGYESEKAAAPDNIEQCESNFGTDFKITFPDGAADWLGAVSAVTVGGISYEKGSSSYSVWKNTSFYADASNNYILVGEQFEGDTAECVISADGYADLVLELNKDPRTATIKTSQGGDGEHTHTGGTATCQQKAVCDICHEEYGELGDHNFENGKCTVCGLEKTGIPSVTVDTSDSTYFTLKIDGNDFVRGISSVLCNGEALEETEYKMALNGMKYYLDKENNAIYFDKMSGMPFKSGDILTIINSDYQDMRLKVTIAAKEVSVTPVDGSEEPGDAYMLHVRLVGYFESALVNQKGYDAISGASTGVTENKNSNAIVEAALVEKDGEPTEEDWKPLSETGIVIDTQNTKVNLDGSCGMAGVYSVYDSSITLAGTPSVKGTYPISVTVTDDQGRTATSNELIFKIYDGQEYLEDQLTLENCTQTSDGKYMYDMEPWAMKNFDTADNVVTVPADIKAWYGSHTSGTYGELGYAIPEGSETTQTLVIPDGCNLTFVNMDILSSVRIVVEDGGTLVLRDSTVQGIVDVAGGGTFSMNYNGYGDSGEFLNGASINGQLILQDGATLENSKIYSNTNFIPNGNEARKNTNPVVVIEGDVNIKGQVFIRGDEAATGTDASTGKSYAGQAGLMVKNGTLNITEDSVLAVYGGGYDATTSVGGTAIILDNAAITGEGKLIAVGGKGTYDDGGNAVTGNGTISTAYAYLEGGNSYQPKAGTGAGLAMAEGVLLSGNTNRNLIDGKNIAGESDNVDTGTYWGSITEIPDLTKYLVEDNAPGETPVEIPVTSVTLNKEKVELTGEGASENLVAAVLPENATNKNVVWTSDDASVASVDETGKVTAVAAGTAVITVTTEDGSFSASCTVIVTVPEPGHVHDAELREVAAKDATCTENGNKAYYICDSCGEWFSDKAGAEVIKDHGSVAVPAAGHTWKTEWSMDAAGHWHECSVCGEKKDEAAHISGAEATATTAQTCTVCDYVITPAIGVTPPQIIEGMNGSWKQGTQAVLIFKSDAAFADFISVLVDGTVVDGANYTVSEGSTVVTMKSAYLETLTVGTHTLTVRSQNGDASTQFTIKEKDVSETNPKEEEKGETNTKTETDKKDETSAKAESNSPKTGDSTNLLLWFALLAVSASSIITLAVYKMKSKN